MKITIRLCSTGVIVLLGMVLVGALIVPDAAQAQAEDQCWFTPAQDTVLFAAPVFAVTQQIGVVSSAESYAVKAQAPDYLRIDYDGETQGYVKRDQGALSGTCGMNISVDSAPLMAHLSLCVLNTPPQTVPLFAEATLQTQTGELQANASYAVIQIAGASYYVYVDEYSGGWIAVGTGTLHGACDVLPSEPVVAVRTATARENARLWSMPDVYQGELLAALEPGLTVTILAGPVQGPINYETVIYDAWYQVQAGTLTGWMWVERLAFAPGTGLPSGSAVAQVEARAWSQPDVNTGQMLASIPVGTTLQIIGGPVTGAIRYDTGATGEWYYTSVNGTALGWVWAERLSFGAP